MEKRLRVAMRLHPTQPHRGKYFAYLAAAGEVYDAPKLGYSCSVRVFRPYLTLGRPE